MIEVGVQAVGLVAPGLKDWPAAVPVLAGTRAYVESAPTPGPPLGLAPNERRRASLATRLALDAAQQATSATDLNPQDLVNVFASSDGDMSLVDRMCEAIYREGSPPSPTVFQNSVHNAVAGYWSIASGCQQASTTVAAGDGSFAAGMLEAGMQAASRQKPLLFVAYDVPAPPLLHPHRSFSCAFACALVLTPMPPGDGGPMLGLGVLDANATPPITLLETPALETMRSGNPAARALPLLRALAVRDTTDIVLPYWPDLPLIAHLGPAPS